jgi:hypothetical protein
MRLNNAVGLLDMSIMAAKHVLASEHAPLQRRLAWLGAELERLASEAYRLADEAGDDTEGPPDNWDMLPGFDPDYAPNPKP